MVRKNIRLLMSILGATVLAAVILLTLGDGDIELPGGRTSADLWRITTMGLAGSVLAYMTRIGMSLVRLNYDQNDNDLMLPFGRLFAILFLMTSFIGIQVYKTYGVEHITWKTPLACVIMISALITFIQLNTKFNVIIKNFKPGMRARFTVTGVMGSQEQDLLRVSNGRS